MQNLLITTLSFNHLDLNNFTKSKHYLSTIGWKMNVTRRSNDKLDYGFKKMNEMDYGLKEMNEMDYGLKKMNNSLAKTKVMWVWMMMWWWDLSVMKSITEQRNHFKILIYNQYFLLDVCGVDLTLSALHSS